MWRLHGIEKVGRDCSLCEDRGTLIKLKKVNLVPYMTTQPARLAGINDISIKYFKYLEKGFLRTIHVISSQVRPSTKCT